MISMTVGGLAGKIAVLPLSETLQWGALVVVLVLICGLLIANLILSVRRPKSTVGSGTLTLHVATILAVISAVGIVVAVLLYAAYQFPGTTGFGRSDFTRETTHFETTYDKETTNPYTKDVVEEPRRAKTLWDWLQLLIVPLLLAGGGFWFNWQQERRNREGEDQRECDAAVQAYIDQIGRLLVDRSLRKSTRVDDVYQLARTLTLRVLTRLNESLKFYPGSNSVPLQKREVLEFLYLSELIVTMDPVIPLRGADMTSINLADTEFIQINLMGAMMVDAVLDRANLKGALLRGGKLNGANLNGTNLSSADLTGADLTGASVSKSQLRQCGNANLAGATMYDGTLFTPVFLSG